MLLLTHSPYAPASVCCQRANHAAAQAALLCVVLFIIPHDTREQDFLCDLPSSKIGAFKIFRVKNV